MTAILEFVRRVGPPVGVALTGGVGGGYDPAPAGKVGEWGEGGGGGNGGLEPGGRCGAGGGDGGRRGAGEWRDQGPRGMRGRMVFSLRESGMQRRLRN